MGGIDSQVRDMISIMREVALERDRQDSEWGGPGHDDQHTYAEWHDYIHRHLERAAATDNPVTWRYQIVRVIALGIAAIQSHDRIVAGARVVQHECFICHKHFDDKDIWHFEKMVGTEGFTVYCCKDCKATRIVAEFTNDAEGGVWTLQVR